MIDTALDGLSEIVLNAEPFEDFYRWVLRIAGLFLVSLGIMVFASPARARAFLKAQASTLLINCLEGALRLIVGVALLGFVSRVNGPDILRFFAVFIAVSALAILFLPSLHKWFARWAVPFALKIMPIYGAGALLIGLALLSYTVFHGYNASP